VAKKRLFLTKFLKQSFGLSVLSKIKPARTSYLGWVVGGGTTPSAGGTSAEAEEVEYGSGKLDIINSINYNYYGSQDMKILHRTGASEGYDIKDSIYFGMFNPSGIKAKIVSNITGYELEIDSRPPTSLSTIYLELSLHSQGGGAITINSTNELRLSMPLAGSPYFYNFTNKTLTLQQYNPSDASASYPSYDVRDVIEDNNGVITLARLDGTYESEVPYAWFRVGFS